MSFFVLAFVISVGAGVLGALLGLGGGLFITPALTLMMGVPVHQAMGASLVAIIATSSGAAAAFVRDRFTNVRVAVVLEVATTVGALIGSLALAHVETRWIYYGLAVLLLISVLPSARKLSEGESAAVVPDGLSRSLGLGGQYPDATGRRVSYEVTRVPLGLAVMFVAGILSGLLGIGAGAFKVLAMDTCMRMPLKASSATANFMVGVTAATSAWVYRQRGWIDPLVTAPVALGAIVGSIIGARLMQRFKDSALRKLLIVVLGLTAAKMFQKGWSGG